MADQRAMLRELAREIRALVKEQRGWAAPSILPSLGNWFAGAVYDYLRGKEPDLEKALGLKRGRGRPMTEIAPDEAKRLAKAKKKKSWVATADDFRLNERGLQRKLKRFGTRIDAEKNADMAAKIIARMAKKPKPRPRRPGPG